MAKAKLERTKPHVSIGTIGHVDHGRAITAVIITEVLADKLPDLNESFTYDATDKASEGKEHGITINVPHVEYQMEKRHYVHVNAPGHAGYIRNMVVDAAQVDDTILVVATTDDPMPQTHEHALLAHQAGVPYTLVTLNKYDMVDDGETIGLVKMEVRELLAEQDYDGEAPTVHISVLKALEGEEKWVNSILEPMEVCDENIPGPVRETDKPFLMPIEDIFTTTGRGTVAAGHVEHGVLSVNDEVEILSIKEKSQKIIATSIGMFHELLDPVEVGDNRGLLPRGTKHEDIGRGQTVARPGTCTPRTELEGSVYIPSKDEGGHYAPFLNNYRPQLYFRTTGTIGAVSLPEGVEMVMSGGNTGMFVKLIQPITMDEGLRLATCGGDRTAGTGRATEIIK